MVRTPSVARSTPALPALTFTVPGDDTPFGVVVDGRGEAWASIADLAPWLGYASASAAHNTATRYAAELAEFRSFITVTTADGRTREVAFYSERAWYRLAMVAQTKRGARLRALLGDLLRGQARTQVQAARPAIERAQDVLVEAEAALEEIAGSAHRAHRDLIGEAAAEVAVTNELLEAVRIGRLRDGVVVRMGVPNRDGLTAIPASKKAIDSALRFAAALVSGGR